MKRIALATLCLATTFCLADRGTHADGPNLDSSRPDTSIGTGQPPKMPIDLEACARHDLDGSGDVGLGDIILILSNWGACPHPSFNLSSEEGTPGILSDTSPCIGDVDGGGTVGFEDLLDVLGMYGDSCIAVPVP